MIMIMNEKMIDETVENVVSTVKYLCEKDLTYLELSSKLDTLNEKMDILQTLVIYSEDKEFTNTICAMQLITDNFNNEIMTSGLGTTFSTEFRERQLNFLRNISKSFDIVLKDVENVPSLPNTKSTIQKEYKKKVSETKKEYQSKTNKETVDEIIETTNKKINNYFESESDLKEYLKYMSKFHKYSIGNCSLIEEQFGGAIAVGSFKFWKDNGFSVNKGEKGIQILVPTPLKKFIDAEGNEKYLYSASKEEKEKIKKGELKESTPTIAYKKGYVFDVSQTNATASDLPKIFPNKWLDGDIKDYDKMYFALKNVASEIGVNIIAPKEELGVSKGVSYPLTKEVALNPRNSELQNVKTLIHELAHAKLHTATTRNNYTKQEREFQAEMTAYSICSYFGIDTSEYSLSYLHHYTKGSDIKEKKKLLNEIRDTSKEFIEIIENTLALDLDIALDLSSDDLNLEIEYETSDEIAQAIADVIDAPTEYDEKIYTKFIWSENEDIDDGSIYEFNMANEILETLTELHHLKKIQGYDKTKFELYFDKDCTDRFYGGRFDIGDGYAKDLKTHIYKHVTENQHIHNMPDYQKYALFSTLGIDENTIKPKLDRENKLSTPSL